MVLRVIIPVLSTVAVQSVVYFVTYLHSTSSAHHRHWSRSARVVRALRSFAERTDQFRRPGRIDLIDCEHTVLNINNAFSDYITVSTNFLCYLIHVVSVLLLC